MRSFTITFVMTPVHDVHIMRALLEMSAARACPRMGLGVLNCVVDEVN